jgi:hypothetical protein
MFNKFFQFYSKASKSVSDWNKVNLTNEEIERKERLIQTFIVVFGLLVSNDHNFPEQHILNYLFYEFFFCSLGYYAILSKKSKFQTRGTLNFLAVLIAFSLGCVTKSFVFPYNSDRINASISFYSHRSLPSWFVNSQFSMLYLFGDPVSFQTSIQICMLASVIIYSLWV